MVNSANFKTDQNAVVLQQLLSALFYALSSTAVVFVNKILLTNYNFPSFLYISLCQMLTTVIILYLLKQFKLASFPRMDSSVPKKIFPLPILFAVNMITGFGGTQRISLPMFTALRRFAIPLTMLLEYFVLGELSTFGIKLSVFLMVLGSAVAAIFDLSFDLVGYAFIFVSNMATAANGVYTKKKLDSKELGKSGLLFYNSLFMLLPLSATLLVRSGDTEQLLAFAQNGQLNVAVLALFTLCCLGGILLNYSTILCTAHNSALTTACVGSIKNLFITYVGMFSNGDYVFSMTNFVGINVSVLGSVLYTYIVTVRATQRQLTVLALPMDKVPIIARPI